MLQSIDGSGTLSHPKCGSVVKRLFAGRPVKLLIQVAF
jgi:hypothetical protein